MPALHKSLIALTLVATLSGCATLRGTPRVVAAGALGGAAGAGGGAFFSPNKESQGLNALVFGLGGALVGALLGLFTDSSPKADSEPARATLQEKELGTGGVKRAFEVPPSPDLPKFIKDRLQPVVIEEYENADAVGEDGSLHEPHRVYRIKQGAELYSRPIPKPSATPKGTPGKQSDGKH